MAWSRASRQARGYGAEHDRQRAALLRREPLCRECKKHGRIRAATVASGNRDAKHGDAAYVGEPLDDTTFAYVCALDEGDDPLEDPSCWVKANPLLGVTITEDYLQTVVAQAKAIPGKLNNILRLHFCTWTARWQQGRADRQCRRAREHASARRAGLSRRLSRLSEASEEEIASTGWTVAPPAPETAKGERAVWNGEGWDVVSIPAEELAARAKERQDEWERVVVAEREGRMALGFDYDFGDERGVHRIGTTEADLRSWDKLSKMASAAIALDMPDTPLGVTTDTGPTLLTAMEWQQVLLAWGLAHQPLFQASFDLQALQPFSVDHTDDQFWP